MAGNLFNHEYPYTDFHELNLDWIIKKVHEINETVNSIYTDAAKEILARHLDDLLPDATYDATHERLIIHVEPVIVAGGEHVYSPSEETITIEGGV